MFCKNVTEIVWVKKFEMILFFTETFFFTARRSPFTVGVNFDSNEVCTVSTASMTTLCETNGDPGGIVGFKLIFFQGAC